MNKPFLEIVARLLAEEAADSMEDSCILVPNRRSGLFLKHHLLQSIQQSTWMPEIIAIGDFVDSLSTHGLCEGIEAVFLLYDLYTAGASEPESLDEFYHWGEIMLADFDEIDKYLVDPNMLFRNLSELKELEEPLAGMEESQINFIRQFWKGFSEGEDTPEKRKFLQIWDRLPLLYRGLRSELEKRNEAYPGMQYREVCERISEGQQGTLPWSRIWVLGFNALNACEVQLFHWLQRQGGAFFWDVDAAWEKDPMQEAARFMHNNLRRFPQHPRFTAQEPDPGQVIRIFELPSDVLQARAVHKILQESKDRREESCTDTAVVLCDEELLMPVLLALPQDKGSVNITMGYPLSLTSAFGFLQSLFTLQHNARVGKDGVLSFYHRDVSELLMHPFMASDGKGEAHPLLEEITRENLVRVPADRFSSEVELLVFQKPDAVPDFFCYLRSIIDWVLTGRREEEGMWPVHRTFLSGLTSLLNHLERLMVKRKDASVPLAQRILRKMALGLRVPFEGEPLTGMQLMGILETRLLDFRHVVLLSMNEEVMPAGHGGQSYVPATLRLAYGMPGKEDRDAIYAYYFSRLLLRAEQVDLLYNSTSEGVRTGEMSRYLHRMIFEKNIEPIRPSMEVKAREVPALSIRHNALISEKLRRYSRQGEKAYLSPSAINTFISCPLRFYFRYLAGLGESDQVQEEINPAGFGTVVHESMKVLYDELAAREKGWITEKGLRDLLSGNRIQQALHEAFMEEQHHGRKEEKPDGRNLLVLEVMERHVRQIIKTDQELVPFELLATEDSYERELEITVGGEVRKIRLGGKIDRVDRVRGRRRVIDYKTGRASTSFPDVASLFEEDSSSRNGAGLQTLLYAWLLGDRYGIEPIAPGLYILQSLMAGKTNPLLQMGKGKEREEVDDYSQVDKTYTALLRENLERLFDADLPFGQTNNEQLCRNCDYAGICERRTFA